MATLNTADKLYLGSNQVSAAYLGATKVFPAFKPSQISGMVLWLDPTKGFADQSGAGNTPTVVGTPAPTVVTEATANNQKVYRFTINEGRVRKIPFAVSTDFTSIHVTRTRTSNVGRGLGAVYPGPESSNCLLGTHISGYDSMYDDGWLYQTGWPGTYPTPWRMYSADSSSSATLERWFVNGTLMGTKTPSHGFGHTLAISGYDPDLTQETCDIDVGEVCIYDHQLTDAERQQVENYLRTKYAIA